MEINKKNLNIFIHPQDAPDFPEQSEVRDEFKPF